MSAEVFDARACHLGEGPLWHPGLGQLFWFDILGRRLLTRGADGPREWQFGEHVSAAGWIDERRLLIASESRLFVFDLGSGAERTLTALEADNPATRSNDGRADPQGGFWIGTMGKAAEPGAGAIYRWYRGELRRLYGGISIPNAICFAPAGDRAYFADSPTRKIQTVALDAEGWPVGEPRTFADLGPGGGVPDGAVCDAAGNLWNAEWGAGRIAAHAPDGRLRHRIAVPARNVTCPAFGGPGLGDLHATSAQEHIAAADLTEADGRTFRIAGAGRGLAEHRIIL